MISCDTNILFPACDGKSPLHEAARAFLSGYAEREDFCLSEQVLMELYCLLRNPTVCRRPLPAPDAAGVIRTFRSNPRWHVIDVVPDAGIMNRVWAHAADPEFPYRRLFDVRLAMTLQHHGVTRFATRNLKDFMSLGFDRVWDPFGE